MMVLGRPELRHTMDALDVAFVLSMGVAVVSILAAALTLLRRR
jgi:hypothetical protein